MSACERVKPADCPMPSCKFRGECPYKKKEDKSNG